MTIKKESPRETVAGLVVRSNGGVMEIGTHWPTKAIMSEDGEQKITTVGGGIKDGESVVEAMERELAEEYGPAFASQCEVIELPMTPYLSMTSSGLRKRYHPCLVVANENAEPEINTEEVYCFGWNAVIQMKLLLETMSLGKRNMVKRAYSSAIPLMPELATPALHV